MGKVLHASYSGYFPFCVPEGDMSQVGDGTSYPLGLSLTKAMELYWRVKEWNVSGSFSEAGPFDFNFERNGQPPFDPTPNPTTEEKLVCKMGIGGDFFPPPYDQIIISFYSQPGSEILKIYNANDDTYLYYPFIDMSGNYISNFWNNVISPQNGAPDTITLETFGEIACYKAWDFTFSMVIKPIKWWSYDGLYDEDTGEFA